MTFTIAERSEIAEQIARDGWAITPPVVPQLEIDRVVADVASLVVDGRGGARGLFDVASVRELAGSPAVRTVTEAVLGAHCFAVRAVLFDKTPAANWKVVWHQDLTVAVERRQACIGFEAWSEKDGVPHVQPPTELLERMLAVRVHLDDCGADNGPVRVISGSHRVGRLSSDAIDAYRASAPLHDCLVERGGILAFRPLILHASSAANSPSHRRVVHLEFAAEELPAPLAWRDRVE